MMTGRMAAKAKAECQDMNMESYKGNSKMKAKASRSEKTFDCFMSMCNSPVCMCCPCSALYNNSQSKTSD